MDKAALGEAPVKKRQESRQNTPDGGMSIHLDQAAASLAGASA
jgi:hypothetical protein